MTILNEAYNIIARWQDIPELKVPKTPLGVSGIVLGLLKDYFLHNSVQFKYDENPVESKVLLDLHQQWNPENCENYPGAYVKRVNWIPRGEAKVIGDYKDFTPEDGLSVEYWLPITGEYSIVCVGKEYGEVELLLQEVFLYLTAFWHPISEKLNFNRFDIVGMSPTIILVENKDYRTGQVNLSLMFDFIWKLVTEKPRIQKVKLNANVV